MYNNYSNSGLACGICMHEWAFQTDFWRLKYRVDDIWKLYTLYLRTHPAVEISQCYAVNIFLQQHIPCIRCKDRTKRTRRKPGKNEVGTPRRWEMVKVFSIRAKEKVQRGLSLQHEREVNQDLGYGRHEGGRFNTIHNKVLNYSFLFFGRNKARQVELIDWLILQNTLDLTRSALMRVAKARV